MVDLLTLSTQQVSSLDKAPPPVIPEGMKLENCVLSIISKVSQLD